MVEQAKLTYALLYMIGYERIVMCIYPHTDYLGIKIERKADDTLEWTQPTLTYSILEDLKLVGKEIDKKQNKPNIKSVPANTHVPLTDHIDAAHASEWNNKTASSDPGTARSRMGCIITYAGYPMHWASKMQTAIALCEYTGAHEA
jgi:hypothetical protein